ncbi:MAG TPA: endo-1,4-beta-xylanase [Candidatus Sulfotelmatobacter sp.]
MVRRSVSSFFCIAAVAILLAGTSGKPATLRQAADHIHLLVGAAVQPGLLSQSAYSETVSREFNMVEPENATKWRAIRPDQATFDFHEGDEIVRYAQAHAMKVRGHCLVWDHYNPDWLAQGHFTPAQLSDLMKEHITTVMKHYAGQIFAWDVVNEALNEKGEFKDSIWYNQPGIVLPKNSNYVEQAFRWAREADTQALLFYNEAEGEGMNRKSDAIYDLMKKFKKQGVPIDGVGLQLHISRLDYDTAAVAANIKRLTALGLQVHITELDVSLPVDVDGHAQDADIHKQAGLYRAVIEACLQSARCTAIQTWGFTDKYSWIGTHSQHTRGAALPFDRNYKPKPAYDAMLEAIANAESSHQ